MDELNKLKDNVPAAPEREVIQIGNATLYLGDCLEILPGLPRADAVVTDPPYGTQSLGGGYGRHQLHDKGDGMGRVIANDTDLSALEAAFPLCMERVQDGWLAVFYGARRAPEFMRATASGEWFGGVVWDKGQPGLGYHIRYAHEDIAVFRVGKPKRPATPLLSVLRSGPVADVHPHEKPVQVVAHLVGWVSSPGGIVVDPFMGSGTTGVACVNLGRKFIGIEIERKYFDIACERIEAAYSQGRLFA